MTRTYNTTELAMRPLPRNYQYKGINMSIKCHKPAKINQQTVAQNPNKNRIKKTARISIPGKTQKGIKYPST